MARLKGLSFKRHRHQHKTEPPGTLNLPPDAPKPTVDLFAFDKDRYLEQPLDNLTELDAIRGQWPVVWVNVNGLGDLELIRGLQTRFALHQLALEDVLTRNQRPKIDEYEGHLFILMRMGEAGAQLGTEQVCIFVGNGFVITFQEHPGDCLDELRERIRKGLGRVRAAGADYLAYCIMDAVIDGYYPYLDSLNDEVEELEAEVLESPTTRAVARIHQLRRSLLTIRRAIYPLREALNRILRDGESVFAPETAVYLRDGYDHVVQMLDTVDTYRELVSGLLDIYLSSVGNRMNEVMKVLTIMASLFIPLSFLVGLYGMNFDREASPYNMPELGMRFGYPVFLLVCVSVVVGQLLYFRRKGWIGGAGKRRKDDDSENNS